MSDDGDDRGNDGDVDDDDDEGSPFVVVSQKCHRCGLCLRLLPTVSLFFK